MWVKIAPNPRKSLLLLSTHARWSLAADVGWGVGECARRPFCAITWSKVPQSPDAASEAAAAVNGDRSVHANVRNFRKEGNGLAMAAPPTGPRFTLCCTGRPEGAAQMGRGSWGVVAAARGVEQGCGEVVQVAWWCFGGIRIGRLKEFLHL